MMSARTAPPTMPPTIAPFGVLEELLLGVEVEVALAQKLVVVLFLFVDRQCG